MGPKRMRFVRVARAVSDVHVSSDGRVDTPPSPVRWSERQSDSKPKSSAACARRNHRSHVSPSCPSIMMPTFMLSLLRLTPYRIHGQMEPPCQDLTGRDCSSSFRHRTLTPRY